MTTNAQHTPGPWTIVEHEIWDTRADGEPGIPLFRRDNNYRRWGRDLKAGEAEANARLIAAAPTLLDAAIYAREVLAPHKDDDFAWSAISQLTNAIALATGEPK